MFVLKFKQKKKKKNIYTNQIFILYFNLIFDLFLVARITLARFPRWELHNKLKPKTTA
jgi:hypothetical protein